MGQILHGSAKTTIAVRAAIQRSQASVKGAIAESGIVRVNWLEACGEDP